MNTHSRNRIKSSGIPYRSMYAVKCTRIQGKHHKYIISNYKRCYNAVCPCGAKTITGIISRVANDNHNSVAKGPANLESLFNKRGANAEALEIRVHNKRR